MMSFPGGVLVFIIFMIDLPVTKFSTPQKNLSNTRARSAVKHTIGRMVLYRHLCPAGSAFDPRTQDLSVLAFVTAKFLLAILDSMRSRMGYAHTYVYD